MTMKRTRKLMACIALAAVVGASAAPAFATTLKMAWSQDATGLDPHKQTAFSSIRLLELIYEPLVRLDADLKVVPAIATSWTFADDAKTLTFKLDPKAKFHNGAPVTSADVKASYLRILDQATGASARANYLSIQTIDTPDDQTVVFHLSQPDVPLLASMSSVNAAIVPASEIAAGHIGTAAVGSGPFKLSKWEPNVKEELSANTQWAGGKIGVDGINISVLPDESAILAAMRTKQVDFALLNDPLIATLVPGVASLKLSRTPVLAYHALQLNPSRKPMTELAVRQAISCAIDRKDVLDTALLGEGKITGPLTMPEYRSNPDDLFCYKRDLAKAKKLMADAGYKDGFSATVIAATGEPATAASEAQVIQSQLKDIGVKLDIKLMELNVYVDTWLKGDFDMAIALNGGRADPYAMYNRYWTKTGNLQKVANYIDDTLDSQMQQARIETDPKKRKELFAAFDKHLAEVSPWIWLYTGYGYTAQQQNVQGFTPSPDGSLFSLAHVTVK
ncbi:ABC transporter substrate-binding protein [Rhizobium sp.]|uniref:ABC transporter substrate-binding protein n=1 Tax=Rhizobium sp. TaxID=391 RepID=UPI000E9243E2|nr:ABC transporter substrate-binding protein [Rhizobium sp.]